MTGAEREPDALVSMPRHDYQRLIDARDAAADRADAETERRVAAEARVREIEDSVRLLAHWYDTQINWRDWGIGHSIRAALSPAQGETGVEG